VVNYSDDDQLARSLQEGDVLAQEAYFDRFQVRLIKFAMRKGFAFHDAEELAQEALAKGVAIVGSFIPGTEMIRWLNGIEYNFMRQRWSERKGHPAASLDEATENEASRQFAEQLSHAQLKQLGRLWAKTLAYMIWADNQTYINAVQLRYFAKMTDGEIEEALGLGKNVAKVYVQRGLKALKKMHDADAPEDLPRRQEG
jgi:DNA-directed RNA polymerase specialized sigma24 family protein